MGRELFELCALCKNLCRVEECAKGHKLYLPLVEGQLNAETARKKILEMLQEAKFNKNRLDIATSMLKHLEQFLNQKGHKIMCLQVKRTLESLEDRREP